MRVWKSFPGKYKGSLHSTSHAWGTTGITVSELRFELSGTPSEPLIYLELDCAATSAWNMSSTYLEKYTNIPERTYGVRGRLTACTYGPNQLVIHLLPNFISPNCGAAMILTFHDQGTVEIDYLAHFERRGSGSMDRVPAFTLFRR